MPRSSKGLRANRRGSSSAASARSPGDAILESRFIIKGATWELYDRLSDAVDEGQGLRLAFDGKDVEIMVLGPLHEGWKELLATFIRELAVGLDLDHLGLGQTTWKRFERRRGIEADLCFYFDPLKIAAAEAAMARDSNDVIDYPNPDLAVEIDVTRSKIDRPSIYQALEVAEVWRLNQGKISIEQLDADRMYKPADQSRFLRVALEEIERWLASRRRLKQLEWVDQLRRWIESDLRPRSHGGSK